MKLWTAEHQRQLDALVALKQNAEAAYADDIDTLLDRTAGGIGGPVSDYLRAHGQQVLDMLLKHFDPSGMPTPVQQPGNWQNFADAVALSKHG